MTQKIILLFAFITIIFRLVNASNIVNKTILWSAKEKGAVCLDGSPPAYHFAPGTGDGINSWMIFLEGGAWCSSVQTCYDKITVPGTAGCGSSKCKEDQVFFSGILSESNITNPDFCNWNRVWVRYCDGSSFSGDIEETILYNGTVIYRRGARIFDAIMEAFIPMGMGNATNALLAGSSAGGLATILHCDGFRNYLPFVARLKCISGSGFFIHGKYLPSPYFRENYFGDIVTFHDIGKSLPISCTQRMDSHLCIFPENLVGHIETPLFILNSAFDTFQIQYLLEPANNTGWQTCTNGTSRCNASQIQTMKDFRTAMLHALPTFSPSRGLFIESCYSHSDMMTTLSWDNFIVNNKTMVAAVGDWYYDRSSVHYVDMVDSPRNCTKT